MSDRPEAPRVPLADAPPEVRLKVLRAIARLLHEDARRAREADERRRLG